MTYVFSLFTILALALAAWAHRRITLMEQKVDEQLARIDEYTNELGDDLDRLSRQVLAGLDPVEVAQALEVRADKLRLVADKSQGEVVPTLPDPVAPLPDPTT